MAKHCLILLSYLCLIGTNTTRAQGTSCSDALTLSLNGTVTNYATSPVTGTSVLCSYAGSTPVTWFQLTTNAAGECPLLSISATDNQPVEIAMYASCTGSMIFNSSMCFAGGSGLWAPSENYALLPSTTYYLRVRTGTACSLQVSAQSYTPPNNTCQGAFSITTTPLSDNNACHKPPTSVTPAQLCAMTLENTAFYQFYVATTGVAIININSIACNNGPSNNSTGFQIGFFSGNCSGLNSLSCTQGAGTFVQATTPALVAGTKVTVAIDGVNGSNCRYAISGVNVFGVLETDQLKHFSAWKKAASTLIRWSAEAGGVARYIIERSSDGIQFQAIGTVNGHGGPGEYSFEDVHPLFRAYYRMRSIGTSGEVALSNTIMVERKAPDLLKLTMPNPVRSALNLQLETEQAGSWTYEVVGITGQVFIRGSLQCQGGTNAFRKDLSFIPDGRYILRLQNGEVQESRAFVKMN